MVDLAVGDLAVNIINLAGGFVFSISLTCQLYKIIRSKSAADLSWIWAVLSLFAIGCGLVYGSYFNLWPIYSNNSLQFVLQTSIIIVKFIMGRMQPKTQV